MEAKESIALNTPGYALITKKLDSAVATYSLELREQNISSQIQIDKSEHPIQAATSLEENNIKKRLKSVLVVGGTDGSGTRRVVQMLTDLGVTMVSEDPETYDIHADLVGGWPPIVSPVLSVTHSLNYDPDRLPDAVKKFMSRSLRSLLGLSNLHAIIVSVIIISPLVRREKIKPEWTL